MRILLFVPDKNGENLFPNFGLLLGCESGVIRLLCGFPEIWNPNVLGPAQIGLGNSENAGCENTRCRVRSGIGDPVIFETKMAKSTGAHFFQEILAEREWGHHNNLLVRSGV